MEGERPSWRIIQGDCLAILPRLAPGSARLIFADPPYNIGVDYGKGPKADRLSPAEYLDWCRRWIEASARLLAPDGSLWVLINDEWADEFGCMLSRVGLHRRAWIKWYESFGVNCRNNFNRTSRHLFSMVKDPERFVFNADAVRKPDGSLWGDVWGIDPPIPRVCGTFKERIRDFPTQLPIKLLRPIVGCASDPGDLVADPFSGSATTGAACVELGRRYIGVEESPVFAECSRQRLASMTAAAG